MIYQSLLQYLLERSTVLSSSKDKLNVYVSPETMMKIKMNHMYGLMVLDYLRKGDVDMFEGQQLEYADTDSVSTTWQKLPDHLLTLTVQEFQEVMDDGLANGFEFRIQGSTIEYREVQS